MGKNDRLKNLIMRYRVSQISDIGEPVKKVATFKNPLHQENFTDLNDSNSSWKLRLKYFCDFSRRLASTREIGNFSYTKNSWLQNDW